MTNSKKGLLATLRRELAYIARRPIYLFASIGAPLLVATLLLYMMGSGLPSNMPVAVVDEDHTSTSRALVRSLDAFQSSEVVLQAESMPEALAAMRSGEVYGILHIPKGLQAHAGSSRQPKLHYYTNSTYLMAGSFVFKDMKMLSELASAKVGLQVGQAKGVSMEHIMGSVQPISVKSTVMSNPWLNYSAYLLTVILPGIIQLMVFLLTSYSIGVEIKRNTAYTWLETANGSIATALIGKLLPQTLLFLVSGLSVQALLYGWMGYPLQSGWGPMGLAILLLVLAGQAMGIIFIALIPIVRMAMSVGSLIGMLSFSISGMSLPVSSMLPSVQALAYIFPLRYYYQIGINQALLGAPWSESVGYYLGLLCFALPAIVLLPRLKRHLLTIDYIA